ncbi:glycosyltransferase family 4 protein [bacterium]|nr:glycosyltransferase family 4 protein [bacterium]
MRIAMIGTKGIPARWGGIEKYIEEVGKRLAALGHEVTVFGSSWFCKGYNMKTYHGIFLKILPVIPCQALSALNNSFLASTVILLKDYDIVNFHGYASYFFLPVIQKMGKITIVTAHGVESGWSNPKYGPFERFMIRYAFRLGITRADSVFTVADYLKTRIKKDFHVDAHVLPSGLDTPSNDPVRIIRDKYGLNGSDYLLFLGRIDPIKRVDWIADLLPAVTGDIKIVIAGGIQDQTTKDYLKDLKRCTLDHSRIIFTGHVSGREKTELLRHCIALLAPSYDEGLPITVLESLSYGRFCIASDILAHKEVIAHGVNGLLFPRDDKDAFIGIVRRFMHGPKRPIEESSQKNVIDIFNWDNTAKRTETLYRKIFDERKSRN